MSTKIIRKTASIFGGGLNALSNQVEQFGSKRQTGTPNYTVDPAVIQSLAAWSDGWAEALNATNGSEYLQDRNGVDFVASYQIAYLLQQGIAEWDSATPYFINSIVQYGGIFYKSLIDNNTGNEPDISTSDWVSMNAPQTQTIYTSGSGTYTPPPGCSRLFVRMVGGGGGGGSGAGNGGATTLGSLTAGGGGGNNGSGGISSGGNVNINGGQGFRNIGGSSFFGGAGGGLNSAATNSGSGGGGLFGGAAGGYLEALISNPTAMSYTVGAAGSAVSGSGSGGSGIIIISEYY